MRKILSWIAIAVIAAAFVTLCLVFPLKLNIAIPIVLFAIGIILFFVIKRMPADEETGNGDESANGRGGEEHK